MGEAALRKSEKTIVGFVIHKLYFMYQDFHIFDEHESNLDQ